MKIITLITLDGYKDWNVVETVTKTVPDNMSLVEFFNEERDADITSLKDLCTDEPVTNLNVTTCMGEENGFVFVII